MEDTEMTKKIVKTMPVEMPLASQAPLSSTINPSQDDIIVKKSELFHILYALVLGYTTNLSGSAALPAIGRLFDKGTYDEQLTLWAEIKSYIETHPY